MHDFSTFTVPYFKSYVLYSAPATIIVKILFRTWIPKVWTCIDGDNLQLWCLTGEETQAECFIIGLVALRVTLTALQWTLPHTSHSEPPERELARTGKRGKETDRRRKRRGDAYCFNWLFSKVSPQLQTYTFFQFPQPKIHSNVNVPRALPVCTDTSCYVMRIPE